MHNKKLNRYFVDEYFVPEKHYINFQKAVTLERMIPEYLNGRSIHISLLTHIDLSNK